MGFMGIGQWMVILVIVVVLFGAKRLPAIGQGLGQGIRNFKNSFKETGKLDEESAKASSKETRERAG